MFLDSPFDYSFTFSIIFKGDIYMGTNYFASLEDLRSFGRPQNLGEYAVEGMSELGKIYMNKYDTIEDCIERSMEHLGMAEQFGIMTHQNIQTVEAVSNIIENRNRYIYRQRQMGVESFYGVKMIDPLAFSLEANGGTGESFGTKLKNWVKKIANAIKEAFRQLILSIGNFIKAVISWFKSATVKRQAEYYEKYKNVTKATLKADEKIKCLPYKNNALQTCVAFMKKLAAVDDRLETCREEIEKGIADTKDGLPGTDKFKKALTSLVKGGENTISRIYTKEKGGKTKEGVARGTALFNYEMFSTVSPKTVEQNASTVVENCGGFAMLSRSKSQEVLKIVATGRKFIKGLSKDIKSVDKIVKSSEYYTSDAGDKSKTKERRNGVKEQLKQITNLKKVKSDLTNNLFSAFFGYVRMRTVVFTLFKKCIKKGEGANWAQDRKTKLSDTDKKTAKTSWSDFKKDIKSVKTSVFNGGDGWTAPKKEKKAKKK